MDPPRPARATVQWITGPRTESNAARPARPLSLRRGSGMNRGMAQIKFQTSRAAEPEAVRTAFLAVPIREGRIDAPARRRLDRKLGGSLLRQARDAALTGKESSGVLHRVENGGALRAVYLVG